MMNLLENIIMTQQSTKRNLALVTNKGTQAHHLPETNQILLFVPFPERCPVLFRSHLFLAGPRYLGVRFVVINSHQPFGTQINVMIKVNRKSLEISPADIGYTVVHIAPNHRIGIRWLLLLQELLADSFERTRMNHLLSLR
jgi:hypothetical protein